jgi:predicted RNase H-like HicB family nuclease
VSLYFGGKHPRFSLEFQVMRQVLIYPDTEDGGWVCEVPSLPGCVAHGDTKEQAIEDARDAIQTWIDAAEQLGRDVPDDPLSAEICLV